MMDVNTSGPEATGSSPLSDGKDGGLIEPPYDGQRFVSFQEMVVCLKSYANAIGFQWRNRTSRKNKISGEVCAVRMVCSKEGNNTSRSKSQKYFRPSRREGCNVAVSSTLQNDGQWKINKICLHHCHEIDLKAIPSHLRQHLLLLNDRSDVKEQMEEEEQEEKEGKPYDGQTFGSYEELTQYLNSYAKGVGFVWRIRTSRKGKNSGKTCAVRMVCSKQKQRSGTHTQTEGCCVAISSTLQKDGQWKINKIHLQHSHEMDPYAAPILRRRCLLPFDGRMSIEEEEEEEEKEDIEEEEGEEEQKEAGNLNLANDIDLPLVDPPYNGQTFGSLKELNQYLLSYSNAVGFIWRKRTSRKDEKSGEIRAIRMVCNKEGKIDCQGLSMKEGCHVAISSTLQVDGQWKINKINLQHSHEIDPNARLSHRRGCRSIPHRTRSPLVLNYRLGIEDEKVREGEEEGAVSVAVEQHRDATGDKNDPPSINDELMEEQPSFEASLKHQDTIEERGTTCPQSNNLAVNVEQHWKRLKRDMGTLIESSSDSINELSDMERTVDILISQLSGDGAKTRILQGMRQLLTRHKDKVSCLRSSKNYARAQRENLYKDNPNLSAMIDRGKLALQAEEEKLSQLISEETTIEQEIRNLLEKKQSVLSQKASATKNIEKGKQKMRELMNTQEKIHKAESSFFKWQTELSNANATFILNLMDSNRVLFK